MRAPHVQRLQHRPGTDPECPVEPLAWALDALIHPPGLSDKSLFSVYSRFLREAGEKQYVSLFYYNMDDFIFPEKTTTNLLEFSCENFLL